jgi:hypothetical protein
MCNYSITFIVKKKNNTIMRKLSYFLLAALSLSAVTLQSCDDKPDPPPPAVTEELSVKMTHSFGSEDLELNGKYYLTENQDSFQLTTLIYHINNFKLYKADGSVVEPAEDRRYFMVDYANDEAPVFNLGKIDGSFNAIEFTLGVLDSTVNATGALSDLFFDPMYWGMANGYIGFKLEGNSPSVSNEAVVLHAGGYLEPYKVGNTIKIELGSSELKNSIGNTQANLNMDLSKYFYGPNTISLDTVNLIHKPNDMAVKISENWGDMITFTGLE